MRRDILPLKPDLILSAHGMNGLLAFGLRRVPEPNEPGVRPRASALIGRAVLTIERAAHDWRSRNSAEARPAALAPIPDAELMKSRYAEAYRKLIALARAGGVDVALADASMAINEDSPREVKDFYGAVFKPIDDIIAANAAHNRMVRLLSAGRAASRSSTRPETSTDNGTMTSISTSSTSPKRATNAPRTPSSASSCRSWPSARACDACCGERQATSVREVEGSGVGRQNTPR